MGSKADEHESQAATEPHLDIKDVASDHPFAALEVRMALHCGLCWGEVCLGLHRCPHCGAYLRMRGVTDLRPPTPR